MAQTVKILSTDKSITLFKIGDSFGAENIH